MPLLRRKTEEILPQVKLHFPLPVATCKICGENRSVMSAKSDRLLLKFDIDGFLLTINLSRC